MEIHYFDSLPPSAEAQEALAVSLMGQHMASAAFIIAPSGERRVALKIFFNDEEQEYGVVNRTVDVTSGGSLHEALAIIIRAATFTIIERRHKTVPEETTQSTEPPDTEPPDTEPPSPTSKAPPSDEAPLFGRISPIVQSEAGPAPSAGEDSPTDPAATGREAPEAVSPAVVDPATAESRQDAEPAAPGADVPAESPRREGRVFADAAYASGMVAPGVPPWHGLALGLGWQPSERWQIVAEYIALARIAESRYGFDLVLKRHPVLLGARFLKPFNRIAIGAAVMFEVDIVTEQMETRSPEWELQTMDRQVHLALVEHLLCHIRLHRRLVLFLNVGIEALFTSTDYVVGDDSGNRSIVRMWSAQPTWQIGIRGHFF